MIQLIIIPLVLAVLLRCLPLWLSPNGLGVDHWYWKKYIETYLHNKMFPPVLPQYIFDEFQWYPPVFPLVMAYLPRRLLNTLSQWLAIIIDLLRMITLLIVANLTCPGNDLSLFIIGLIYATTPILISYNIQLNPRGLGALFLDILIVLVMYWYLYSGPNIFLVPIIILSALILITHKMTTQIFWFLSLGAFIITFDYRFLLIIPTSVISALIISKGFYWKVLKAHWDIITFWYRNWPWLQAHPIKESPIYGESSYETPTKHHRKGWKGFAQHLKYLFGFIPSVWCYIILMISLLFSSTLHFNSITKWTIGWASISLIFVLATIFIPMLRCLGSGYLYLYNLAFPASLLWALGAKDFGNSILFRILLAFALILNVIAILFFYKRLFHNRTQRIDSDFIKIIEYLNSAIPGTVMCLPPQWYDVIAYKTNQPVLYGGHGYGFKMLEPVFPRLLIPLNEIIKRYGVKYLVSVKDYLPENFLLELENSELLSFGEYRLYILKYGG